MRKVSIGLYVTLNFRASLPASFSMTGESSDRSAGAKFSKLVGIMARLRAPNGCPWDREQNFDTIKPYLLEETYEVMDAIDAKDWRGLAEELGDLMLQSVFFAQMAEESGLFSIEDSLDAINAKLIRRHPHIFGDGSAQSADEVKKKWDQIKAEEKRKRQEEPRQTLDGIPRVLPALVEASQISSKAAGVGFDWPNVSEVLKKVREEIDELEAHDANEEEEFGDLLFALVNYARFRKIDPEQALRKSNSKFRMRFSHVEARLSERGRSLEESSLDEMEALWQEAKRLA
jgi:tetrapyrrole methylase family protein / MazG family protein